MSTKKLGILALVAVLVIGAVVIGVLLIGEPQDDPPAPAQEDRPAQEVADDPPAEEPAPAPITAPDEIVPPSGFTALLTMDVQGAAVTNYAGSGTARDALDAFQTSVIDAGWTPILEGEVPVVPIPEIGMAAGTTWTGFERGDEFLGIWAMQAEDQTTVTVAIIPKEVLEALADEAIPAEEVPPPPEEVTPTAEVVHYSKLVPFLPEAPSGWVAEEPIGMMMTFEEWPWSMTDRHYTKPGTGAYATIAIVDSAYHPVGPWMMWGMFFEHESADGYLRRTTFKGYPAWEEHSQFLRWTPAEGDHTVDQFVLTVGINGRFLVSISVSGSDRDTLYAFANAIDFQGISAIE